MRPVLSSALLVAVLLALTPGLAAAVPDGGTVLVDRPSGTGPLPEDGVTRADVGTNAVSADGCFVVFTSGNDDLLSTDEDAGDHIYRADRCAASTPVVQADTSATGVPASAEGSFSPSISNDGRYVAFTSEARNLHPDTAALNNEAIYVKDLQTGTLEVASRADGAAGALAQTAFRGVISGDGRSVAFTLTEAFDGANADGVVNDEDLYVRRLDTNRTYLASVTSGGVRAGGVNRSYGINNDGTAVAFQTESALVAGDADGGPDAYLVRSLTTTPEPVWASYTVGNTSGAQTAADVALSSDGSTVAWLDDRVWYAPCPAACGVAVQADFPTPAATSQQLYDLDFPAAAGAPMSLSWVTDRALLGTDTNGRGDLHVRDLGDFTPSGLERFENAVSGSVTEGAAVVAFTAVAGLLGTNGVDGQVYVRYGSLSGFSTALLSQRPGPARATDWGFADIEQRDALSADGRVAVFASNASALGAPLVDDRRPDQVLTRDLGTDATTLVSATPAGVGGNGGSFDASVDHAGTTVAFVSVATDLVPGVAPGRLHAYVRRPDGVVVLLDRTAGGTPSQDGADEARISGDGRTALFTSSSPDLPDAAGGVQHVYAVDLATGAMTLVDRTAGGVVGTLDAEDPHLSTDGRRVAFRSRAANFPGASPGVGTIYVKDRVTGELRWVAVPESGDKAAGGAIQAAISGDGRVVAFQTLGPGFGHGTTGAGRLVVRDVDTGATAAVPPATGAAGASQREASLSEDGTRIAFDEFAPGDAQRIYLRDLAAGTTTPVATGRLGGYVGSLAANGRCVAFAAYGDDYVSPAPSPDFTHVYIKAMGADCGPGAPGTPGAGDGGAGGGGAAGAAPGVAGPAPAADTTKPVVSALALTNRRFALSPRRTAVKAAAPMGTTLRFTLSEDATTTVTIARRTSGRRSNGRCVKPRKGLRRRCTRYETKVTLTRTGTRRGPNRIVFSGRWGRKHLAPGRYRATVVARDAAGNLSVPQAIAFTVVRR